MLLLNTNTTQLVRLTEALYGAAPGYTYLQNFLTYATSNGLASTANALASNLNASNASFKTTLLTNLGLTTNTLASSYIDSQLNSGASQGSVALNAVNALATYSGTDSGLLTAKTTFNTLVGRAESYSTNSANTTTDLATLQAADDSDPTTSFLLTTSGDLFSPSASGTNKTTAGDDIFTGSMGRLGSDDSIDGGAGNDTLTVIIGSGAAVAAPVVRNVETINVEFRGTNSGLDFTDITGATRINISGTKSGQVQGLTTAQTLTIAEGFNSDLNIAYANVTGSANSVTVNVANTTAFALAATAGLEAGVESLTIHAQGNVTLGNTANASAIALPVRTLGVAGTGNVTLFFGTAGNASGLASLSALQASGLVGNLTLDYAYANDLTLNAGAGNDTINLYTTLETNDSIDMGAGTDTVRAFISDGVSTVRPVLNNVEILTIDGANTAATLDLRQATSLTTLNTNATAGDLTYSNLQNTTTTINIGSLNVSGNLGATTDVSVAYTGASVHTVNLGLATTNTTGGLTFGGYTEAGNTGALTVNLLDAANSGNTISGIYANEVGSFTLNMSDSLVASAINATAAGTISLVSNGSATLALAALGAERATTLNIANNGTAAINISALTLASGLSTINLSANGNLNLSALTLDAASANNDVTVRANVASGATINIGSIDLTGLTTADQLTFTLSGSGNFTLGNIVTSAVATTATNTTANVNGTNLGGILTIGASAAVSGLRFDVTVGDGSGNIILGAGNDIVLGGAGRDTIEGGAGNDELRGGGAADTFVYVGNAALTAVNENNGLDVLTDFATADLIQVNITGSLLFTATLLTGVQWSAIYTANTAAIAPASGNVAYAVGQRGSDVVIQVLTASGSTGGTAGGPISSADMMEIILQGETWNSSFTVSSAADGSFTISNIVTV